MMVWGGEDSFGLTNTGGVYDPVTDTWTDTSLIFAPSPRHAHTAVWTGTEMIVWGGVDRRYDAEYDPINTGGLYVP